MGTILLTHANVVSDDHVLEDYSVFCRDGRIEAVLPMAAIGHVSPDSTVDVGGQYLTPGFIDLHVHGSANYLFDDGRRSLEALCSLLPRYGVTGFLPTITPAENAAKDYALLQDLSLAESSGTQILGFFLEGHFLSLTGSIVRLSTDRSRSYVEDLQEAAAPYRTVFGVSPELEGITELIPVMCRQGFPAFITHTKANVDQTREAIQAGAHHATHFYNVFPYIGDQEGGVRGCGTVEAILADTDVSVDFILDGEHVHPVAVEMALACKGRSGVVLITDANVSAGLPPGRYRGLGQQEIEVSYPGGPARLAGEDLPDSLRGGLSGSGLTMDLAVRNAVRLVRQPLVQAVAMASTNPARVLGLDHIKGHIKPGYDADMVTLDQNLCVTSCWVQGSRSFTASVN